MDGNNPIVVSSKQLTNLPVQGSMSHTASVDTSSLPTNAWSTAFGARLSGLAGDGSSRNNIAIEDFNSATGLLWQSKQQSAAKM